MHLHKIFRLLILGLCLFAWSNQSIAQSEPKAKKEKISKQTKALEKAASQEVKRKAKAEKKKANDLKKELAKANDKEKSATKEIARAKREQARKDKIAKKELAKAQKASSNKAKKTAIAKTDSSNPKKFKGTANTAKANATKGKPKINVLGSHLGDKGNTSSKEALDEYKDLGYKESAEQFLKGTKKLTLDDKIRIANSYRLNHEIDKAAVWYAKVADTSKDPIHKLHYAQVLQSNGNTKLAKTYYDKYTDALKKDSQWDNVANIFSQNMENKNRFLTHDISLINEKEINSDKLEYSPTLYQDGVIFVSTKKPDAYPSIGEDPWIKDNFMSLYYAPEGESGSLSKADAFSYDITSKFHEGPVSFSRGYDQIFFTRNDYNNKKRTNSKNGIMKLQIYTSYRDGETWSTPEALPFNTPEHEEAHPALSPDGMRLYFTSDRPGGFGGMDLYVSELTDGTWGEPKNMGGDVNTPGNELFPFVHENGMLFFASNGHDGLGGLDVFYANSNDDGNYQSVNNVGTPFNSMKDDFGFIINAEGDKGYLTSARKGGSGKDDIYSFELPVNIFNSGAVTICTYDEVSGKRISGVEVSQNSKLANGTSLDELFVKIVPTENDDEYKLRLKGDGDGNGGLAFITDSEGEHQMTAAYDIKHDFVAVADGYHVAKSTFLISSAKDEYCIPLKKKIACLEYKGQVMNAENNDPIPFAEITLKGKDEIPFIINSDKRGNFDFGCIPCGDQYTVTASKDGASASTRISTLNIECDPNNNIDKDIYIEPTKPRVAEPVIKEGDVIVLENIFYDFDKYYIRSDAEPDLNKVVTLMNKYPSMIIELGSHTDARGRNAYNETLSANRAKSAVDYIVSRGIDSRRIVAKGYGETTSRNHCVDGVTCSEEEHQFNRRTEIKVISFGRDDVKVQYNDNRPDYIDPAPQSKRKDPNIERKQ